MNIDDLQGEELFSYLRTNKTKLIEAKKASMKFTDSIICSILPTSRESRDSSTKSKSSSEDSSSDPAANGTLNVTIVGNASWILDSHMDVLTDKAYTESIKARGNSIPHIADHLQTSTSHVADVNKVYTKDISLKDLGMDAPGSTKALLFDSTVRKDYNPEVFKFYANGKINQHSIGLTYGDISLAINSSHESDKEAKVIWDKAYPKIINKELADKRGYFYLIPKVDVREVSTVLFGANPLTPTLSVKSDIQNSSLGNTEEIVINQPIGNTMTLEEAQGKIISLNEELTKAKADIAVAKLEGKNNEQARITGILKAAKTFGTSSHQIQDAALSFIEKDASIDTAITSFEVIKEALQISNHVDTSANGVTTPLTKSDVNHKSTFHETLDKAFEKVATSTNLFAGVK